MSLEKELIAWYEKNRRHMPWREDPLPYHVYLSEIMLQQTQVDTVRSYYLRFLKSFPTIAALAEGSEEEVLKLWEGLGYYSRGRNLHKAAEAMVANFGSQVPMAKEDLLSLPGIGEYTSRAIRAIAFHQKEIAVDGNLIRVYARLAEDKEDSLDKIKESCEDYFRHELKEEDPSKFNQALMDIGEMVCLPKALPLCSQCPLRAYCASAEDGTMLSFPAPKKAKEKRQEAWTVLVYDYQGEFALEKRPETGLLASLYQFPLAAGKLTLSEVETLLKKEKIPFEKVEDLGTAQHVFSHLVWDLQGYRIFLENKVTEKPWVWANKAAMKKSFPVPSAFAYYLKAVGLK